MNLPKLSAHALLILRMFVKVTFTHISHDVLNLHCFLGNYTSK